MKLKVKASTNYDILIDKGLTDKIDEIISKRFSCSKILIITDSKVPCEYSKKILNSLDKLGYMSFIYTIQSGELSKNYDNFIDIQKFLAENLFSRQDMIIAVGGGVVGDLAGFVSSTYMRGIKFVNIPTTLLACIDSSVGGKTAINLDNYKNIIGTFYQPNLVIIDTLLLNSLPKYIFNEGMGEAIKYGIIDKKIWKILKDDATLYLEKFIYNCLLIKKKVVQKDEKEGGLRQILNLGHTFGHAIEKLSNFEVLHGLGVVKGIVLIAKLSYNNGEITLNEYQEILEVIKKYNLDYSCNYKLEELKKIILRDKKAYDGFVNLVCIKRIGKVYIKKCKIDEINI